MWDQILQFVLTGVTLGSTYALVALGFAIIYTVSYTHLAALIRHNPPGDEKGARIVAPIVLIPGRRGPFRRGPTSDKKR